MSLERELDSNADPPRKLVGVFNGKQRRLYTRKEARAMGYKQLTYGYRIKQEGWMMENTIKDQERRKTAVIITESIDPHRFNNELYVELWRK